MTIDLDGIRERANAANPGPWRRHDTFLNTGGHTATVLQGEPNAASFALIAWLPTWRSDVFWGTESNAWNNAEFMAHARQDIPTLLAEVERLREQLDRRARNEARLMNALDQVELLTKDTDGGDVDGDVDIPVGELRRVLAEAVVIQ